MIKGISLISLLATLALVLGAPVDLPISFSTTVAPLTGVHNASVMASVCVNMTPVHGTSAPMTNAAPYVIHVSQSTAAPGDTVQVKIVGKFSEEFRGVYIQGRHEENPVGQFLAPGPNSPPVTVSDCEPGVQNAASYISRQPINELTLDYVVPDVPSVVFKATFVKSFSVYWVFVSSDTLLVSNPKA